MIELRHPDYEKFRSLWEKWRLTYEGGDEFIDNYLKMHPGEDQEDFTRRKAITYNPPFAQIAIDTIKNSIFQRINHEVTRIGGPDTYQRAIRGDMGGVDLKYRSMNAFLAELLTELLPMKKVGVFVDMPNFEGQTLADKGESHPYCYFYKTEDILNWTLDINNNFNRLLVRHPVIVEDDETGLPIEAKEAFRYFDSTSGTCQVTYLDESGKETDSRTIELPIIPFAVAEIKHSLLKDTANYQIAHMNLASNETSYAHQGNNVIYTQQYGKHDVNRFFQPKPEAQTEDAVEGILTNQYKEVKLGGSHGVEYPEGTERPGFISPSAEPLKASMAKCEQMKAEIWEIITNTLRDIAARSQSAEAKKADDRGLEAGLSTIALELQTIEAQIAYFWSLYEGASEVPTINYPDKYELKSDEERIKEATALSKFSLTSPTGQKEIIKQTAKILFEGKVTNEQLNTIYSEIDSAPGACADPVAIASDAKMGLVSNDTASLLRGYQPGEAEKAKQDQIDRVTAIAVSQTQGMGAVKDQPTFEGRGKMAPKSDNNV